MPRISKQNDIEKDPGESVNTKRQRKPRQTIDLEQLKNDPNSFLSLRPNDPILRKLETRRLYLAGYAVADIADAFGYARTYLYDLWARFEQEGTEALVDKRWGTEPRKRTTEGEAQVLRAKALHPERSDGDLGKEFDMDRSTVYRLLVEHGMQDLHRILVDTEQPKQDETPPGDGEKGGASGSHASTLLP
jgi:transposase